MGRILKYFQAINEAIDLCMARDPRIYIMGLGVPDPKGIFGSTLGLQQKYGSHRVMDMPVSEAGMTGVAIGSALVGMRPIMTHQRIDFALVAVEQIVNQAAKWHYMFGGQSCVPLIMRMIIGRGWGQGPQHAQSLQSWFAHIPGLKVVMPATPYDVKGLMISSLHDNNPIIFIEHRWLYDVSGYVPEGIYYIPIGKAKILRPGKDLTIVAVSYMILEALQAAEVLSRQGIQTEIIDVRTLQPLDDETILSSVHKTGRLIVADTGWRTCGFSAEIIARLAEREIANLKCSPYRITLPDCPAPTTIGLARFYYPGASEIIKVAKKIFSLDMEEFGEEKTKPHPPDVPNISYTGPF